MVLIATEQAPRKPMAKRKERITALPVLCHCPFPHKHSERALAILVMWRLSDGSFSICCSAHLENARAWLFECEEENDA